MPIKERLTAIEKLRIVAGLTKGLLIKILATEMKRDIRTLPAITKNPNIKSNTDSGTRRNLSARDLRKIRRGSTQSRIIGG